jgi:hypothetical protein
VNTILETGRESWKILPTAAARSIIFRTYKRFWLEVKHFLPKLGIVL